MSGGLLRTDAPEVSSYAILSQDYLNLNFRFGYHFVVVDTLCDPQNASNYVFLSFKGGGGISSKRQLRARFLADVLKHHEFAVDLKGDRVEAQLRRQTRTNTEDKLNLIGRLLGCTRLLDMVLEDEGMVKALVSEFLKGNYRFGLFAEHGLRSPAADSPQPPKP
jgi:pyruvate,water dikinase